MKTLFFVILFYSFFNAQNLISQSGDISSGSDITSVSDLSTDRPDQSESPYIVDKGYFQIESGIVTENDEPADDIKYSAVTIPTILMRYGLAKNVELRAGIEVINSKLTIMNTSFKENGLGPLTLGTKIKLFTEKNSTPETALILSINVPFKESSAFQSDYAGTEFRFAMSNTLSKRVSLSYNLGAEFGAGSRGATGIYSASLGYRILNQLAVFAELYGFLPQKTSPDHRFDAGFTYLVLKNVQLDASFGFGLSKKSPDFFIGGGVSVRLPK